MMRMLMDFVRAAVFVAMLDVRLGATENWDSNATDSNDLILKYLDKEEDWGLDNNGTVAGTVKSDQRLGNDTDLVYYADSNYTANWTTEEDYLNQIRNFIFPKTWTWVLIVIHCLVFTVGIVGNMLVCIAVYRNHSMRTVTNYFIVNLAIADFLVILFCLAPTVVWDVTLTWFFGIALCKIVLYIQTVSVTVSVLTLTFISIDRWYAICYPLKFRSTTGRAKTAIGIIWFLALLFDIPELVVYTTKQNEMLPIDTIYFTQCEPTWSQATDTFWTALKMLLLYIIPLIFMTVTYYQIIGVLWRSGNANQHTLEVPGRQNTISVNTNTNIESQLRSRIKAAKMLVAVVIMFGVCYFPVHLLSLLRLTSELKNTDTNRAFALMSHWLCYANSAVNPLIYNFMSGKFRKEFRRAIDCCSSSDGQRSYEMNSFYYKSRGDSSMMVRSSRKRDAEMRKLNNSDTEFMIQRRGTRTSVVKIEL
ncbi:PREDICTED: orexin receptor type 2-like [Nicrophorus vespilloides]|uniref:Orexin receptor type 2-like n=1 Tax=Nicrophorus vespilloides TaxID=110193 RepID=A0ABM1N1U1_NICVS|nr:PREDICTED: orexin receptor type 2-like [Nicrophorus vespilloides]